MAKLMDIFEMGKEIAAQHRVQAERDAARKHLQTLPQPVRYVVTMSSPTPPLVREFDTHAEAIAYLTVNLTRYENFQIRVAE